MKKTGWALMAVLAVGVSGYAISLTLVPTLGPGLIQELFERTPLAAYAHFIGGGLVLLAGAFQVNNRLRERYTRAHRWTGRLYVAGVLAGGTAGFVLAFNSMGGLPAHFGFGLLALCWVGTTLNALRHVLSGRIEAHRAWMLRSYALTFAAVTLRLYLPLSQIAGLPFEEAYTTIAWLCWVPNLLVVEWFILSRPSRLTHAAN
jgi:uncharacterized membrane protein